MLPSPSRLKSLASEFSPVLTTPPPVEPKTVLVLISVPEMMLSSNFVPFRRRAAMSPAMPPMSASAATPSAQFGVLENRSAKKPGGSTFGAGAAFGADALAGGVGAAPAGAVSPAFVSAAAGAGVAGAAVVAGAGVVAGAVATVAAADPVGGAPAVESVAAGALPPLAISACA